jgi:hypothetical protein
VIGDQQPMTWAEFMKRCHERPLPRAVLDDPAVDSGLGPEEDGEGRSSS